MGVFTFRTRLAVLGLLALPIPAMAQQAQEHGQQPAQPQIPLTIDAIFDERAFQTERTVPIRWVDDAGSGFYTTVDTVPEGGQNIVRHDPATGSSEVIVTAGQLTPDGGTPIQISDYAWSDNGRYVLIHTNTRSFRRYEPLGDYWVLDLADDSLRQVGADRPASSLMYAKFSPDGSQVAYLFENNIYVESIDGGATRAMTTDGTDLVVNGTGDWVNEEEFFLRDGFAWSPDSRRIAYWQFDTEGVGTFYMMDNLAGVYSQPVPLQYPKAGTTNSAVRVGVVDVATAQTTWVDLAGDPRQIYVPAMEWAASSDELLLQHMNRLQNRDEVMLVDVATGEPRTLFTETDDAWVDVDFDVTFFADGAHFTWMSERDGWRRLYRVDRATGDAEPITPAATDVIELVSIDTAGGWAYYLASPDDHATRYLYRSPLEGDATAERLTPAGPAASHSYSISADARWAIHSVSSFDTPPVTQLISLPDHAVHRTLVENAAVRARLAATPQGASEFFSVTIPDGTEIDGWVMFPPDFDPAQQYPLVMYVYGEPWGQTVQNNWGGNRYLYHRYLAQQGYIVASVDNRGTPVPRGRDWRKVVYEQIGVLASADQAQAVEAMLAERPYLDPARVGIWGWSGGGSMTLNAMFRYPEVYAAGIAVAPVPDIRLYDTIYQERYMGLPQENPGQYAQSSPITFAENLQGELLIVHGTGDDNVHYQGTEQLIDRLIAADRDFAMMLYPNRSHSISERENSGRHLYRTMAEFLRENLPVTASSSGD
ncbi:prolyl oligopeptidase family serine peptidase [Erythrobacter arachoides]|uniref:Prolyl oligopeptidase family serine peptidase n=1 Tax=Aurantiacibacter arachoides TaxID=1850444 RepID=A0A844ZZY7_9SPHN|nr:DPP IV N-terminal domain-containing protein [Aurantiacibacter arachoides]MXO92830.1 prolyl oligopeptidase family serine peptidase [Aurantiacibacter arachoides]GGD54147.1 peptidase S9 [Aurantiacibacter arachoides]